MAWIETGVASKAKAGEPASADRHLIKSLAATILIAVIDGLGHGEEAAHAADQAVQTLESHAEEPLVALLQRCTECLRPTRGAVMSLASIDPRLGTLTWVGVGNVEAVIVRADPGRVPARDYLLSQRGIVGRVLPVLRQQVLRIERNDVLALATDGVGPAFCEELSVIEAPQRMAERLLARYGKKDDDALMLVVRYLGGPP